MIVTSTGDLHNSEDKIFTPEVHNARKLHNQSNRVMKHVLQSRKTETDVKLGEERPIFPRLYGSSTTNVIASNSSQVSQLAPYEETYNSDVHLKAPGVEEFCYNTAEQHVSASTSIGRPRPQPFSTFNISQQQEQHVPDNRFTPLASTSNYAENNYHSQFEPPTSHAIGRAMTELHPPTDNVAEKYPFPRSEKSPSQVLLQENLMTTRRTHDSLPMRTSSPNNMGSSQFQREEDHETSFDHNDSSVDEDLFQEMNQNPSTSNDEHRTYRIEIGKGKIVTISVV